jgi:transposase
MTQRAAEFGASAKVDQVLRLLGGESARRVAHECGVGVETVLDWRDVFVRAGARALGAVAADGIPAGNACASADATADDEPQFDWRLDEERLGNMVSQLGAMILEQKATGS